MPPMNEPLLGSTLALARDIADRVGDPLAGARIDLSSAQALLAPPSSSEQTALAIALLGNARAAMERIHAVIAHMTKEASAAPPDASTTSFEATWGSRVLLVDDHPAVLEMLGRALKGYDVVALASPRAALERITSGERFAFIISDLMMAEMTGDALWREIQRVAPEQAERFIFMSGGALTAQASDGVRAAARPVIAKPFKPLLILRLLAGVSTV